MYLLQKLARWSGVILLSALLLLGSYSKEAIHLFTQHHDTEHDHNHHCPPGEAHMDPPHHHCTFLSFVLTPFAEDSAWPFIVRIFTEYSRPSYPCVFSQPFIVAITTIQDRGPPFNTPI